MLDRQAKQRAEIIPDSKKNKSSASNANDAVPPSQATVRISLARLPADKQVCSNGRLRWILSSVRAAVKS